MILIDSKNSLTHLKYKGLKAEASLPYLLLNWTQAKPMYSSNFNAKV